MIERVRPRARFAALAAGRRRRVGPVSITAVPTGDDGPPQVAYAVGRRVGHAPRRHQVRRRLRHVMRARESQLRRGYAYLVGVGRGDGVLSYRDLDRAVDEILSDQDVHEGTSS